MTRGDIMCEMEECYSAMGRWDEAEGCLETAMATPPVRLEYQSKVAWHLYQRQGDVEGAIDTIRRCLARDDKNGKLWYYLGRIHLDQRNYEDADEALLNACERDASSVQTWMALGELYSAVGKDDFAMRALERATELDESGQGAKNKLASLFEKTGRTGNAMALYDSMDPDDPKVKLRKNQILHNAALRLQRIFRGNQARKAMANRSQRRAVRNYGMRAPLRAGGFVVGSSPQRPGAPQRPPALGAAGQFRSSFDFKT
mmetsp:Transcript_28847/g.94275  ORF Transcript_28847/g.94275 Transcript_28847/m.94275 type:complete len:258 (+) Transcript_28847:496-1269(+)